MSERTRDPEDVLAEFVRQGSITLGGAVDHDFGDSTILIDGVDLDDFFKDVQSLGWHIVIQVTTQRKQPPA